MVWLAATANPLWYATRGTGTVAFVLLSATVGLGMLTSSRWQAADWPRFLVFDLHRDISLLAVSFGIIHVATSLLDPFARLGLTDALVPFASAYRPIWLGLGVVSGDLLAAVIVTSLLRQRSVKSNARVAVVLNVVAPRISELLQVIVVDQRVTSSA